MKTKKLLYTMSIAIAALGVGMLSSCKKNKDDDKKTDDPVWISSGSSSAMDYLKSQAKAPKTGTVDAATGGSITQDGITVNLPAGLFANADGSAYSGTVNLKLFTVTGINDMIYSAASCISDSGDLLISGGMFKLEATDGSNNKLKVKSGQTYSADLAVMNDLKDKIFKGTTTRSGTGGQVSWDAWPNTGVKRGPSNNSLVTGLDSFQWCNLDRYMSEKPLTDIHVTCPAGFTSANTEVFMKYTGEKAAAYIPANATLKQFTTSGAYYKVVQGRGAKILALCKKDGKYYYATITITAIGANHAETITSMTETTESDFKNQINNF